MAKTPENAPDTLWNGMARLKPCPFCGARAEVKYRQKYPDRVDKVVCTSCAARTRRFVPGDTIDELWNKRVSV